MCDPELAAKPRSQAWRHCSGTGAACLTRARTPTGHVAGVEAFAAENKGRMDVPRDEDVSGVLSVGVGRCRRFVDGGHE